MSNPNLPIPPDDATLLSAPTPRGGTCIGAYRLLEKLGEGGMGEVWKAEQTEPVRRIVAVKLVKPGLDSREVIARFDAERQALAMMDHATITKVLDAGTTEAGRPYFVMEYVAGVPITAYCDRHKLGMRERLELFQLVCEGVQHAHQKAVLHRDLKPGNVLVTDIGGSALPKIIDFGVAKALTPQMTGRPMYTEIGQILGTPEYMSPEQADFTGDNVDTRSDVYSLGVILYLLLAGALPFEAAELRRSGYEGIRRMLLEQEPPRPSTRVSTLGERITAVATERGTNPRALRQSLRGDLDWIIMRTLEKDRNRRYGSPHELAQELRRYLANEPVEARPPSAAYRAGKFVRRNRTPVFVTSLLLLLLVAFAVTSLHQARSIARERDRAEAEAAKAQAMNQFLRDMLVSADPWTGGDKNVTVVSVLDTAVKEVGESFPDQPLLEAEMRAVLGSTYLGLGMLQPAEEQTHLALETRLAKLGPDHPDVAESFRGEAIIAFEKRDDAGAIERMREALRILRLREGEPDRKIFLAQLRLGEFLIRIRDFAAADSALSELERLVALAPGNQDEWRADALVQRASLAMTRDDDYGRADSLLTEAIRLNRAAAPETPAVPMMLNNLGTSRMSAGKLDDAKAAYAEAMAEGEQVYGTDHPEYATILENLANVNFQQKNYEEAAALLDRVLDIRRRNLGPDNAQVLRTMHNMGALANGAGDPVRAVRIMAELEPRMRAVYGPDNPDLAIFLRNHATYLGKCARFAESDAKFADAVTLGTRVFGENHAEVARTQIEWAASLNDRKRWGESERKLDKAFPVILASFGENSPRTKFAAKTLAAVYQATGRPAKVEPLRKYLGD